MILLLLLLLAPVWSAAQQPKNEQPDYAFLASSAYLQNKATMQLITFGRIDTRRGDASFPSVFLRTEWGLTDRWELDLVTTGQGADFVTRGDSLLGTRFNLLDETKGRPFSLSMGPQLLFPTGHVGLGTSLGRLGYAWDVTASKDFGGPFFTYYGVNYAATPRPDFVFNTLNWSFALGMRPLERDTPSGGHHDIHLFAEYAGTRQNSVDGRLKTTTLTSAAAPGIRYGYKTKQDTLIEIGVSVPLGLTHASPNYGWIVQLQFETNLPGKHN